MISQRLRAVLEDVATLDDGEITSWTIADTPAGPVRIGTEDARRILHAEDVCSVLEMLTKHGITPTVWKTLLSSSGVETIQITKEGHEQTAAQD